MKFNSIFPQIVISGCSNVARYGTHAQGRSTVSWNSPHNLKVAFERVWRMRTVRTYLSNLTTPTNYANLIFTSAQLADSRSPLPLGHWTRPRLPSHQQQLTTRCLAHPYEVSTNQAEYIHTVRNTIYTAVNFCCQTVVKLSK